MPLSQSKVRRAPGKFPRVGHCRALPSPGFSGHRRSTLPMVPQAQSEYSVATMVTLPPLQERCPQPASRALRRHVQWATQAQTTPEPTPNGPAQPDSWLDTALWCAEPVRERAARLVGAGGHRTLMARAVALACAEHPWLSAARLNEHGVLTGLDTVLPERAPAEREAACLALRGHFRALLCRFLGADFAEKIIAGAWSEPVPPSSPRATECSGHMSGIS